MANLLLGLLGIAQSNATNACNAISQSTSIECLKSPSESLTSQYISSTDHYWSAANSGRNPACVVYPTSAEDLASVISTLLQYPDVPFAVKSGGHNPNVGFSSINATGVLISLSHINSTTLSSDKSIAYLTPGVTWAETIGALEPYNVAVVGGRVGDIGVGGLLLGCGLSFTSSQYGLPCDHVVNYEVVLSNGSIVNANSDSHPDLFWALKGGGNNFGIVTKFAVTTIPIGQVWGGYRLYQTDHDTSRAILAATADFTENQTDAKAGIIVTVQILLDDLSSFWAIFFFYNAPVVPAGIFDKFPNTAYFDNTKSQDYASLLSTNANIASVYGLRFLLRGQTIPSLHGQNGTNLVTANYENFKSYAEAALITLNQILDPLFVFNFIYQPFPYRIANASAFYNPAGSPLNLNPSYGDQMWMACSIAWTDEAHDAAAESLLTDVMDGVVIYTGETYAGQSPSNAGVVAGNSTAPLSPKVFMNDAMYNQDVFGGYGTGTKERLSSIQRAYDPAGFFRGRTGGFKID